MTEEKVKELRDLLWKMRRIRDEVVGSDAYGNTTKRQINDAVSGLTDVYIEARNSLPGSKFMKCHHCGGTLSRQPLAQFHWEYSRRDGTRRQVTVLDVPVLRCSDCGEDLMDGRSWEKVEETCALLDASTKGGD